MHCGPYRPVYRPLLLIRFQNGLWEVLNALLCCLWTFRHQDNMAWPRYSALKGIVWTFGHSHSLPSSHFFPLSFGLAPQNDFIVFSSQPENFSSLLCVCVLCSISNRNALCAGYIDLGAFMYFYSDDAGRKGAVMKKFCRRPAVRPLFEKVHPFEVFCLSCPCTVSFSGQLWTNEDQHIISCANLNLT